MAATMKRSGALCLCRLITFQRYTGKLERSSSVNLVQRLQQAFSTSATNYKRGSSRETNPDPRKNTQYPYVPGDPLHEDAIRGLKDKTPMTALKAKEKKIDQKKKEKLIKPNVFETAKGLKYEKLMEGDIRLGRTILAAKSNQPKLPSDTILLEGQRLIRDALLLGAEAKCIYFCDPDVLSSLPAQLLGETNLYKILYKDIKTWSDTSTPAGILGLFKKPHAGEVVSQPETVLPITLIFDSLKDPGNAGTLIRTAAAVGCERLITTKGSVNIWESKVLRSAMGGHFCVPIYTGLSWSDVPNYLDDNTQVFLANSRQSHTLTRSFDENLRSEDLDKVSEQVERLESSSDSESDSDSDSDADRKKETMKEIEAEKRAYTFHKVPLSMYDYSQIVLRPSPHSSDSTDGKTRAVSVALVVGGETEGLSALAKQFAYSHYGQYITIPMNSAVNSLNTGIAGSIILYELRKKLLMLNTMKE